MFSKCVAFPPPDTRQGPLPFQALSGCPDPAHLRESSAHGKRGRPSSGFCLQSFQSRRSASTRRSILPVLSVLFHCRTSECPARRREYRHSAAGGESARSTAPSRISAFSVFPLSAGTVKPYGTDFSVIGQKLCQLVHKIIVIGFSLSIIFIIPVSGGQINTKPDTALPAGVDNLLHHIPFSVLVAAAGNGMLHTFTGPKTESVMVFTCKDQPPHSSSLDCRHPLGRIQLLGIKNLLILRAVPHSRSVNVLTVK